MPWDRRSARSRMRAFLLATFPVGHHVMVTGDGRMAEKTAAEVARDLGWTVVLMFADGARYLRHAEHVRHREMVAAGADAIVVFPFAEADDVRRVGQLVGVKPIDMGDRG